MSSPGRKSSESLRCIFLVCAFFFFIQKALFIFFFIKISKKTRKKTKSEDIFFCNNNKVSNSNYCAKWYENIVFFVFSLTLIAGSSEALASKTPSWPNALKSRSKNICDSPFSYPFKWEFTKFTKSDILSSLILHELSSGADSTCLRVLKPI